jgi:hypothetical protein
MLDNVSLAQLRQVDGLLKAEICKIKKPKIASQLSQRNKSGQAKTSKTNHIVHRAWGRRWRIRGSGSGRRGSTASTSHSSWRRTHCDTQPFAFSFAKKKTPMTNGKKNDTERQQRPRTSGRNAHEAPASSWTAMHATTCQTKRESE